MSRNVRKKRLGIVGGLGALAGADVYFKLVRTMARDGTSDGYDVLFEHRPFDGATTPAGERANLNGRKLYVYDMMKRFEERKVDSVLVPCFLSHTFIGELQPESSVPVVNIMNALRTHLDGAFSGTCKIGVLTTDYVRRRGLFEAHFGDSRYTLLYPSAEQQEQCVMRAIYGERGIKSGDINGDAVEQLYGACMHLLERGADIIVPGATEIAIVADSLRSRGIPIVDTNQAYVDHVLSHESGGIARPFKVGIVGGVGPAATVDFMNKIIRNTGAQRDQDHIRLIVEHNPKIPDRTANLIADGEDPTVALYAACKRLESNDADLIAIPCNTAHAYVERIQPYLSVPIVNMLYETVSCIVRQYRTARVGLLATSGTVASRVYHAAAADAGLELVVPDEAHQELVMEAIYGQCGVKAGHVDGDCKHHLMAALEHLVSRGVDIVILGCTELPLILPQDPCFPAGGRSIALLDPTEILARRCVDLSASPVEET